MASQVEGTGWPGPTPDERDYQGAMDRPEDAHWYREGRRIMLDEVFDLVESEIIRTHVPVIERLNNIHRWLKQTKEAMGGSNE